jgi:hypothetical protein
MIRTLVKNRTLVEIESARGAYATGCTIEGFDGFGLLFSVKREGETFLTFIAWGALSAICWKAGA